MKKIISIVLLLTLCLGLFAGCGDNGNTTTAPADSIKSDLANAKLILRNRYDTAGKDQENKILADKELITVVVVGENSFKVDWTVKVTAGNADDAKIVAAETANTVKLDVNEKPTEELHFTLTATISDGANNTETLTLKCFTPAKAGPAGPAKPVAGTAYKMYMYQTKLAKALYFNGQMSDKYLATTENVDEAVDIFVEEVDGGYHMYFMNGDTKTYIDIVLREGETKKTNVVLVTEPTCVYTWSESLEIFVTHVGEADFFLGTYGTYNTMSPSSTYYITDANAEKIGTEQFLAYLYTKDNLPEAPVVDPTEPTEPSTPDNPTEPADGTVSVVIADYADANGWTSTTLYNEIKMNADITVTVSGTPNGEWDPNSGKYYENGENWRIYQNESPAIVIKAAEGKTIVSVKITYAVKNDGVLTNGDTQVESGTVIAVNGNSITLSVGNTGTKTNGQVQITAIEVIYA